MIKNKRQYLIFGKGFSPFPQGLLKILSFLKCAIDDEIIAILTNFLVFQHEDGGITAQFGFSGLEQRTIIQKRRDGSTAQ